MCDYILLKFRVETFLPNLYECICDCMTEGQWIHLSFALEYLCNIHLYMEGGVVSDYIAVSNMLELLEGLKLDKVLIKVSGCQKTLSILLGVCNDFSVRVQCLDLMRKMQLVECELIFEEL